MSRVVVFFKKGRLGAAALPIVLILGGVIVEMMVASAFVAYSVSKSGLGDKMSMQALVVARAGAMDAVRRVIRNKDFYNTDSYTLTLGTGTAQVTVTKDSPEVGKTRVVSVGTALMRQKKIQADLKVNSTTGEVNLLSFDEVNI